MRKLMFVAALSDLFMGSLNKSSDYANWKTGFAGRRNPDDSQECHEPSRRFVMKPPVVVITISTCVTTF